jgi:CubicO group peptidase (beta-lactamase class C family)
MIGAIARPLLAALAILTFGTGCVQLRVARHGYLSPDRQEEVFASRLIRRADSTFAFVRAPGDGRDLDTLTVQESDGRLVSWDEYMKRGEVRAFLVIRNDTILYERYAGGYTDSTRSGSYSMAKSFTSALLGVALGKGEIRDLDDPVPVYVPALSAYPDYRGVTIRHALEMKTGFAYSRATGGVWNDLNSHDARYYYTRDLNRELMRMRRASAPGGEWSYRDSDPQLIAWALVRTTGRSLAEQLEERIWRRIGTEFDASWSLDRRGGMEKASTGVNATARDYARFGRLYLHGGRWDGAQLIPADWVHRSTTLDSSRSEPEVKTWWKMQHRNLWWIPMHNWESHHDFFADGAKGQRLYVHRKTGTIIVQLADSDAHDFPFRRITRYFMERGAPD